MVECPRVVYEQLYGIREEYTVREINGDLFVYTLLDEEQSYLTSQISLQRVSPQTT